MHLIPLLVAATLVILAAPPSPAQAARRDEPPEACRGVDYTSAESVFRCMGAMTHPGGNINIFVNNIRTSDCTTIGRTFISRAVPGVLYREVDKPSCAVFAQTVEMLIGTPAAWAGCTGYPGAEPAAHLKACLSTFIPQWYGASRASRPSDCATLRGDYERGLRAASDMNKLPDGYTPPACRALFAAVGGTGADGGEPEWAACENYDPAKVGEHVIACLGAEPARLARYDSCPQVRQDYEAGLKAAYGHLPPEYSFLSCADAAPLLARADEERARVAAVAEDRKRQQERDRQARIDEHRAAAAAAAREEEARRHQEQARRQAEAEAAGQRAREALRVAQAPLAPDLEVSLDVTDCDRLAAHPGDPARVAPGVTDEAADWSAAGVACLAAYEAHETTPRLWFQLARALLAHGEEEDAVALLRSAAEAGHAASMAYLGQLTAEGRGGLAGDPDRAWALYTAAAEGGFRPAIDAVAAERPDLAMLVADFSPFGAAAVADALYYGRFDDPALSNRGLVLRYLNGVHQALANDVLFHDPSCPLLVDSGMTKALPKAVMDTLLGGATGAEVIGKAMGIYADVIAGMAQNPDGTMDAAMTLETLTAMARQDAVRIARTWGCDHPVSRHFYENLRRFVLQTAPQPLDGPSWTAIRHETARLPD